MLQRTGEAETITTHYLFALGAYRALYLLNWIYRFLAPEHHVDLTAWIAGILQTVLYSDFFYIYYTKLVESPSYVSRAADVSQGLARKEVQYTCLEMKYKGRGGVDDVIQCLSSAHIDWLTRYQ